MCATVDCDIYFGMKRVLSYANKCLQDTCLKFKKGDNFE